MNRAVIALGAGLLMASMLAGCGRRGTLESPGTPPGQAASEKPSADGRYSLGGQTRQSADDVEAPVPAPKRDFFLDRIL